MAAGVVAIAGRRVERLLDEQLEIEGLRELGRAAEASVGSVGGLEERGSGSGAYLCGRLGQVLAGQFDSQVEVFGEFRRLLFDLVALLAEGSGDALEDVGPAGHAGSSLGRKVGAAEERPAVGGAEDVERPAAVTVQHLLGVHVDFVDVGSFLAVDLDADDEIVLQSGDRLVLEGFALHDVAPVAGGVADADQDGFVFGAGAGPGFLAPGEPVHGVIGVLEEIGRGFGGESIWHGSTLTVRILGQSG